MCPHCYTVCVFVCVSVSVCVIIDPLKRTSTLPKHIVVFVSQALSADYIHQAQAHGYYLFSLLVCHMLFARSII